MLRSISCRAQAGERGRVMAYWTSFRRGSYGDPDMIIVHYTVGVDYGDGIEYCKQFYYLHGDGRKPEKLAWHWHNETDFDYLTDLCPHDKMPGIGCVPCLRAENTRLQTLPGATEVVEGLGMWVVEDSLYQSMLRSHALVVNLHEIRKMGWSVAVHNDYYIDGKFFTFWGFSNKDKWIKGEGQCSAQAVESALIKAKAMLSAKGGRGGQICAHSGTG